VVTPEVPGGPGAPGSTDGDAVVFHVGENLVARVAARRAREVAGVVGLRGDLAQALLGLAGSVLGHTRDPATDGVSARVDGARAEVTLSVVTRLGFNCRDLAQAVQREVADAVSAYTGLDVLVRVTVVDVLLD
jgi:uncharacterized alkaline shock family protein YloU